MPKETIKESDEGGLVRLKYTFKYADKFIEPDDDWLKSIETLSDELLGAYSKAENTALSAAFGGRKKKRLNRVFDAIGFFYPDYCYPIRRQKRKNITSEKEEAGTAPSEPESKGKRLKVFTHRPRHIELASVPEYTGGTPSAAEAEQPFLLPEIAEMAEAPSTEKMEEAKNLTKEKTSETLSPAINIEAAKIQKAPMVTPKRKRRLNRVFDAIGFIYPDYCYPIRRQKRKNTTSAKEETAAAPSEPEPKGKRLKVFTHRPRYIEPASVSEFTGKTSSATEAEKLIKSALLPEIAETAEVPPKIESEQSDILLSETKEKTEAPLTEKIEEVREATEGSKTLEVLSPAVNIETAKNQKGPSVTPKRKRMVNVLDVLETIKSSSKLLLKLRLNKLKLKLGLQSPTRSNLLKPKQ